MKEHIWIPSRGKRLSAMLHLPAFLTPDTPLIVCCHGFTGDKIGANQLTLNLAKELVKAGYGALRFDFLGSGDSEGKFATDTVVAGWQEDLNNVMGWIKGDPHRCSTCRTCRGPSCSRKDSDWLKHLAWAAKYSSSVS